MSNTEYVEKDKSRASSLAHRTQILQVLATITVRLSSHIQLNVPIVFHDWPNQL